jgi:hypothetical protein
MEFASDSKAIMDALDTLAHILAARIMDSIGPMIDERINGASNGQPVTAKPEPPAKAEPAKPAERKGGYSVPEVQALRKSLTDELARVSFPDLKAQAKKALRANMDQFHWEFADKSEIVKKCPVNALESLVLALRAIKGSGTAQSTPEPKQSAPEPNTDDSGDDSEEELPDFGAGQADPDEPSAHQALAGTSGDDDEPPDTAFEEVTEVRYETPTEIVSETLLVPKAEPEPPADPPAQPEGAVSPKTMATYRAIAAKLTDMIANTEKGKPPMPFGNQKLAFAHIARIIKKKKNVFVEIERVSNIPADDAQEILEDLGKLYAECLHKAGAETEKAESAKPKAKGKTK